MKYKLSIIILSVLSLLSIHAFAQYPWKPFGKNIQTSISSEGVLKIQGSTGDSSAGFSTKANLKPMSSYALSFSVSGNSTGGAIISGTQFINRTFSHTGGPFAECRMLFSTTKNPTRSQSILRLGGWRTTSELEFKDVKISEYLPILQKSDFPNMSPSEYIKNGIYKYESQWQNGYDVFDKVSVSHGAYFNDNRWVLPRGESVTLAFESGGQKHSAAELYVSISYNPSGLPLHISASTDGKIFREIAEIKSSVNSLKLPNDLFPSEKIFLRFKTVGEKNGQIQINRLNYRASIDSSAINVQNRLAGAFYIDLSDNIRLDRTSTGCDSKEIRILVNPSSNTVFLADIDPFEGSPSKLRGLRANPEESGVVKIPLPLKLSDLKKVKIAAENEKWSASYESKESTPALVKRDIYGFNLSDSKLLNIWATPSEMKISRECTPPKNSGEILSISAAANECESAQIVFRAGKTGNLKIEVSDLKNAESGTSISASNIETFCVGYVTVSQPTDNLGERNDWPDPLFPIKTGELKIEKGETQPIWLRFNIPENTPPGNYVGTIKVSFGDFFKKIPVSAKIYGFVLPQTPTIRSAFGAFEREVLPFYKNPKSAAGMLDRQIKTKLLKAHISPYNSIAPKFDLQYPHGDNSKTPKVVFDWKEFDEKTRMLISKYHVNAINLSVAGIGGGSFHSRSPAQIRGIKESDPRYEAVLADYLGQIDSHIRKNEWTGIFYTYTFDEPSEKDYPFVKKELDKIKKYAPHIKTMLTEQPAEYLENSVDIWCPVTCQHSPEACIKQIEKGKEIWWYICMQPQAPYAGIFLDHPGVDLRVWLWQSFKYKVNGILVWDSTYMSSNTAYSGTIQNPYFDPMSWASGYGLPKNARSPWGNGDGRLFYPPQSMAKGELADDGDEIVETIRLEMLREGIEDYEYLSILKKLIEKNAGKLDAQSRARYGKLLEIPETITRSMKEFSYDPKFIRAHREKVAEAIEELLSTK